MRHTKFLASTTSAGQSRFLRHSHSLQAKQDIDRNLSSLNINNNSSIGELSDNLSNENSNVDTEKFRFVPSDNSFCFSFDNPTNAEVNSEANSGSDEIIHDSATAPSKNYYQFDKSTNDFSFGFAS